MIIKKLLSTIIPVFNRSIFLKKTVQSVVSQTYRPIEIIIVNDGSTDNTAEIADSIAKKNPEIVKVIHQSNAGAGLAREAGRQVSKGEFVQYLDSDDLLLPNKFEVQVDALRKHPECGIAYGYTRLINEKGDVLTAPYKWTGRKFPTLFPWILVDRWWNTHTPLYRRSVCDTIGPWSNMRMSEDWEYDARAGALGTLLVHCPEFLSDTRQHTSTRLTGNPLNQSTITDISRLIVTLYKCAQQASVSLSCPEMQHFSRWAFLIARQAGKFGLKVEAKRCFEVARVSAGEIGSNKFDFRIYELTARLLGWSLTGKVSCYLDQIWKRKPRQSTLKQSWM